MKKSAILSLFLFAIALQSKAFDRSGFLLKSGLLHGQGNYLALDGFYRYDIKAPALSIGQYFQTWKSSQRFNYFSWDISYFQGSTFIEGRARNGNLQNYDARAQQIFYKLDFGKAWTLGDYSIRDPFMPYVSLGMSAGVGLGNVRPVDERAPVFGADDGMPGFQLSLLAVGIGFESNTSRSGNVNMSLTYELGTHNYLRFGLIFLSRRR